MAHSPSTKDELLVFVDRVNHVAASLRGNGNDADADAVEGYARAIVQTVQRAGIDVAGAFEPIQLLPIIEESMRALTKLFQQTIEGDRVLSEKTAALSCGQQLLDALRAAT